MDQSTQKYLLFSPVSGKDPTGNNHDGPLIHICRVYKPKKVYLYLSKEMCAVDALDNRYEHYLKKLCDANHFNCEVYKIKREDMDAPHNFDLFYMDFTACLKQLSIEHPDHEILLNLSSGTPQMQSALHVVNAFSNRRLTGIQVSTPQNGANPSQAKFSGLQSEWSSNKDNAIPPPNTRTNTVQTASLNAMIKYEIIRNMIDHYDYDAALMVAKTIPDFINKGALQLIEAGGHRLKQELSLAAACIQDIDYELFPVTSAEPDKRQIAFEYILMLQVKSKKGEIADFMRAISPLLTVLFEMYLSKEYNLDIRKSCSGNPAKIQPDRLPSDVLSKLNKRFYRNTTFRASSPCAENLSKIIWVTSKDFKAKKLATDLREIEEKARNTVAHEIKEATEEWLFKQTGCHSLHEICEMLKSFYLIIHAQNPEDWNSYQMLNEKIKSCIPIAASQ